MEVGTTGAERHQFVVNKGSQWIEALGTAVAAAGGHARTLTS